MSPRMQIIALQRFGRLIVRGAPIHLEIVGTAHPPVLLTVGEVPA